MAGIQSIGIGSGIDASSIISQLLALESQPLARLQKAASGVQSQISLYGNMRSKADAVGSSARTLADDDTWRATTVKLNGADEFTVSAESKAQPSNLEVEITSLAQRQGVSTQAFSSASAEVGSAAVTRARVADAASRSPVPTCAAPRRRRSSGFSGSCRRAWV